MVAQQLHDELDEPQRQVGDLPQRSRATLGLRLRWIEDGGADVRVGLLITCLVDGMFPQVGKSTGTLFERLGVDVDVPLDQTCCGQMHINTGFAREAAPLSGSWPAFRKRSPC